MTAYYNEIDPKAAAWLRELIKQGHIADGVVDERSIVDVTPDELRAFTQCHFFAGIGVWSYALRSAGWADDRPVWTGSCPCQPFSSAGRRGGVDDERHLWPHWHHLISQCQPAIVFGEQVASKDGLGWLDLVSTDMEATGYAFGAADLCAAGVGAPHIRQRLFFGAVRLADADSELGFHNNKVRGGGKGNIAQGSDKQSWGGGACGRLADASGAGQQAERAGSIRDGQQLEAVIRGSASGLENTMHPQWRTQHVYGEDGRDGQDDRREEAHGLAGTRGEVLGLADAGDDGSQGRVREWQDAGREAVNGSAGCGGADCWPSPTNGHWRDADWLFCRDGKWRPVEPGTFPLAHGSAQRVGRLRGYGNAIVAQAAQTFIESMMEITE
jgi:DNA (cytosine-5)-methyltransferase 1